MLLFVCLVTILNRIQNTKDYTFAVIKVMHVDLLSGHSGLLKAFRMTHTAHTLLAVMHTFGIDLRPLFVWATHSTWLSSQGTDLKKALVCKGEPSQIKAVLPSALRQICQQPASSSYSNHPRLIHTQGNASPPWTFKFPLGMGQNHTK